MCVCLSVCLSVWLSIHVSAGMSTNTSVVQKAQDLEMSYRYVFSRPLGCKQLNPVSLREQQAVPELLDYTAMTL